MKPREAIDSKWASGTAAEPFRLRATPAPLDPRPRLAAVLALALAPALSAQVQVVATEPVRNGWLDPMQPITVTFDQPVDPATVTPHSFAVLGSWSGPARGTWSVSADGLTARFQPQLPLFAGELVTVSLAHTIATSAGLHLAHGHHIDAYVRSAPGNRQFTNVLTIPLRLPGEGRIGTYGIFAGDVDGDGSPDITSMNEISNDIRVQHNSGCGAFGPPNVIANPNQWPSPNQGADFDGDGRMDLVTGNQNGGAISIYQNDGAGGFAPPTVYPLSGYIHGVAAADFDGDGACDVAAPNSSNVSVLLNHGDGTFAAPVGYNAGGTGEDNVSACDVDEDGIPDLVVGNLFSNTMGFLRGNGDGTFQAPTVHGTGGQPFHQCVGDCNGDGHIDVLFANRGTNTFAILFGDGQGGFSPAVTYAVGQTPAAIEVGDIDGDGDLDVIVANYSSADYSLWWNRGDGVFEQPVTLPATQAGSCSTIVDFDRDGILDIIGADENADQAILYRQGDVGSATSQPPSCAATLRVNQRADRAGFGATAPMPLRLDADASIGISGPDGAVAMFGIAAPYTPGFLIPGAGIIGIDLSVPPYLQVELLDAKGERSLTVRIPSSLQPGLVVAIQAVVGDQGTLLLSNPQAVVLVP